MPPSSWNDFRGIVPPDPKALLELDKRRVAPLPFESIGPRNHSPSNDEYISLGRAYVHQCEKAIQVLLKAIELFPGVPVIQAALAYAYVSSRQKDEARRMLSRLEDTSRHSYVPPGALGHSRRIREPGPGLRLPGPRIPGEIDSPDLPGGRPPFRTPRTAARFDAYLKLLAQ